jgi:hypothetical protein
VVKRKIAVGFYRQSTQKGEQEQSSLQLFSQLIHIINHHNTQSHHGSQKKAWTEEGCEH